MEFNTRSGKVWYGDDMKNEKNSITQCTGMTHIFDGMKKAWEFFSLSKVSKYVKKCSARMGKKQWMWVPLLFVYAYWTKTRPLFFVLGSLAMIPSLPKCMCAMFHVTHEAWATLAVNRISVSGSYIKPYIRITFLMHHQHSKPFVCRSFYVSTVHIYHLLG